MNIFTIGYEGASVEEFIEGLRRHRIRCVADLRKNPVSRKPGFSKKRMGEALHAQGIEYIHFPGLGTPTEWRKSAKAGLITRKKMFQDYVKKVLPTHPEELEKLKKLMHQKGLALLCYEADATDCHRLFVAEDLARREKKKVKIVNINLLPKRVSKLLGGA